MPLFDSVTGTLSLADLISLGGVIVVAFGLLGMFVVARKPQLLWPLLLMGLAYTSAFGSLWLVRIRGEVWRRRAEAAALRAARA